MSSALCLTSTAAATAAVCVTAARPSKTAPSTPSLRRGRSVRARVATETGSTRVGDGVFDSDEVVRPLSAAQKDVLLQSLAADLENQYAEGFTYTPFSAGMTFADPVVILEGRTPYKLMMGPTWFTVNQMLEPSTLRFVIKSLEVVDAEADPLSSVAYPPRSDGDVAVSAPLRGASCAVHCVWETYGTGKARFNLPEGLPFDLGGKGVLEQKEFYMSGQDVYRIDSAGRVMRHESAWDQSPEALLSYLNPLAHIPILEEFLPIFSDAVPKRAPPSPAPEPGPTDTQQVAPEDTPFPSEPYVGGYTGGAYTSSTGYPKN